MLQNRSSSVTILTVVVLGIALTLWFSLAGSGRAGGQVNAQVAPKAANDRLEPFTPMVGRYYQVFMPDRRSWGG